VTSWARAPVADRAPASAPSTQRFLNIAYLLWK
jgi:hypothetical protein